MTQNSKIDVTNIMGKIQTKDITIGVIGLGYVGLPLAVEFALADVKTIGFDIDSVKVESLQKGNNYIQDIPEVQFNKAFDSQLFTATSDFSQLQECDAVFICVPTPFTLNKDPDISFIINASEHIAKYLFPGQIVILKSTTFPGTTEKYVRPVLDKTGLIAGVDYFLAFSPERIDPGNQVWTTKTTPIVVGGLNEQSTELAAAVTAIAVNTVIKVSNPAVAEMEKLLENIFRSVNIALVNEMAQLCDRIGVNIWEVVYAASTKPFGFMPFYPGPGIGGHCILIDPYYLAWMAREYDFETKFITLAGQINESMPFYVRSMIIKEIAKQPVRLSDAKILVLGMSFKRDVDDLRHSPALKVVELLEEEGMRNISYYDPYIPEIMVKSLALKSEKSLTEELLQTYDVVVITTDHSVFDFEMIARSSRVVIDTRNACGKVSNRENIVLLGDGK